MKKTLIALIALSTGALAFDDTVWNFESSLSSETGTGLHTAANVTYGKYVTTTTEGTDEGGNPTTTTSTTWQEGTATYEDSGLTAGTKIGDYYLERNLGKAVTLSDNSFIKVGDAYWSNGDGTIGCGSTFSTSYTLMAWAKFDSISGAQAFFGTGNDGGSGMAFSLIDDNKMNLVAKSVADCRSEKLTTLTANTWYNFAVSYDATANTVSYYLNGKLMGTNTMANRYNDPGGAGAAIGSAAKDMQKDVMSGAIAEFKILDGAYNQTQILSAAGLTIPEPTTATLSLLALAGLAARRRRR